MENTNTITVDIPVDWVDGLALDQDELRQALQLGLTQLRQHQAEQTHSVTEALRATGSIRHLSLALLQSEERDDVRQEPPTLPGMPVSEIIIAQRRGDL